MPPDAPGFEGQHDREHMASAPPQTKENGVSAALTPWRHMSSHHVTCHPITSAPPAPWCHTQPQLHGIPNHDVDPTPRRATEPAIHPTYPPKLLASGYFPPLGAHHYPQTGGKMWLWRHFFSHFYRPPSWEGKGEPNVLLRRTKVFDFSFFWFECFF